MPESGQNANTVLSFSGVIDADLYRNVKRFLVPPVVKLFGIAVLLIQLGFAVWGIVESQNYGNLLLLILLAVLLYVLYHRSQNKAVQSACLNHPELEQGGIQVVITLDSAIHLNNQTTGSEHTIPYSGIYSIAETDKAILCFARMEQKRRYLLMPKGQMKEGQRDQVMNLLASRCGKLKKRL